MGWSVGEDTVRRRHIGYGVPATCDQPGCGARIHRGLAYACGGGVTGDDENCGLFFCHAHLVYVADRRESVCERCASGGEPFDPTPDVREWTEHVLTDSSWRRWRDENPIKVDAMRRALGASA